MNHTYLRGDMYYADLGHGIGSEQEGYRPVVIIQNNVGNKHSPTVIIASITSKKDAKPKLPTHYYIDAENGLELPSIVLLEQLRTVDKRRLGVLVVKGDNLYLIKNFNRLGFLHVNNLTYKTSQRYIFNTFATIFIL